MSFASTRNGNGEIFSDDEFSGDEEENEENNEELGLDRKHDVEKCYQNYLEAVAPDSKRENRSTLPSRADIDFNDMDEYGDDGDIYEELDEDAMVAMARHPPTMSSSAHGSSAASASAASSSVFRRTSSSSATSSFASEDDDYNGNNSSSNRITGRRQSNGQAPSVSGGGGGRAVSGSGVRRQSATSVGGGGVGGVGGVVIEDGLNTAKIVNMKSKLRPVASKVFDTVNNRENSVVGGSTGWPRSSPPSAAGPRPMNNGGREGGCAPVGCAKKSVGAAEITTPQKKRPAVKAVAVESTSDVGTGQNSIRIKAQMARLRPVLSRNDCDDNNIDDQDPPVRDVQKILPIGPAAKKKTSASSASNANRWNQQIQNSPSPPPPPFPSPPPSPPPPAFPLPSPKKTPTFGSTAPKTPSTSQRTQAWHQSTANSPPSSSSASSLSSPFPDPPPVSNGRREPSHTPKQTGQKQDQPWGRAPRSNDSSETPVKRNADRTLSQQLTPATKASHGLSATHPGLGRSGSVNPSSNGYDSSLLTNQTYYFGDLERDQCERKLDRLINEDGSYLVRNSRGGGPDSPYSLSIVYSRHVYHLNIRLRPDGKFSIGKAKSDEKMFNSVAEMISFHQNNAIELIGDNQKKTPSGKVTLKKCPNKF